MNPDANLTPYLKPLTALQRLLDRFGGQGIIKWDRLQSSQSHFV